MKKVLITGKNSYVGNSFEKWLENYSGKYKVDKVSLRDNSWKKDSFSKYDVVIHVAGIAHRKETEENKNLYYKVNRDLAYEVATKAKEEGVSQFIFLSSMSVYGIDSGIISRDTIPRPKSNYGKSKLEAENLIKTLNSDSFKVTILRPPMIYGKGCKGNYIRLSKLSLITPIFPEINNKRSMIFINNLSEFVRLTIENQTEGILLPQNKEYVNTSEMVRLISKAHNKRIKTVRSLNGLVKMGMKMSNQFRKVFGTLIYSEDTLKETLKFTNEFVSFKESILLTEKEYR